MPAFPKIDSPCPLRWKTQPAAGRDFCSQCRRRVHNLDAMGEAERRALLAGCETDICVSYSVPRRRMAAAGLAVDLLFDVPTLVRTIWLAVTAIVVIALLAWFVVRPLLRRYSGLNLAAVVEDALALAEDFKPLGLAT